MARIRSLSLFLLLAAAIAARSEDGKDKASQDLNLLQGTWKIHYHETAGVEDTQEIFWELEIKGDKFTLTADGTTSRGTIKLDPTKKPKQIDYTVDDDEMLAFHGIYEVMGDIYKTCDVQKGKADRPTEFKTKAKTGQVAAWKKVKVID